MNPGQSGNRPTLSAARLFSGISLPTPLPDVPARFLFQTTDPVTNAVVGQANTPVDIDENNGLQSYVVAFEPLAPFPPTDVRMLCRCANAHAADTIPGVNTLLLSASLDPVPDLVALAATIGRDGIVDIPGLGGTGVFSIATVNLGASAMITATADTGSGQIPVSVSICETDPATSACLAAPVDAAVGDTTTIGANETPTFGVFLSSDEAIPFDPANARIFVRFTDGGGVVRGATSVAVQTVP